MIHKSASDKTKYNTRVSFYNSAREAWSKILHSKIKNTASRVLLPSYIGITDREGSGIFDPIIETNCIYDFYELNDDLSTNLNSIQIKLNSNAYDFILVVHYFGLRQVNMDSIIAECKEVGTLVVEDCAHFMNFNYIGDSKNCKGDFAFYSLHKIFPIDKGGCLIVNSELNRNDIDMSKFLSTNEDNDFISYDMQAIINNKRENYLLYENLCQDIDGLTIFKKLEVEDVPHNFPILIEDGLREKLYFWLIERNIPLIALYYRLIEPLQKEQYSSMQLISGSILNLPVHQDINLNNIVEIVELIKEGLSDLKK